MYTCRAGAPAEPAAAQPQDVAPAPSLCWLCGLCAAGKTRDTDLRALGCAGPATVFICTVMGCTMVLSVLFCQINFCLMGAQGKEAREWKASMQRALAHWSDHTLYGGFAQWHIFTRVRAQNLKSIMPSSLETSPCSLNKHAYTLTPPGV